MNTFGRRLPRTRRRKTERGVALVLVLIFMSLMLLLGLAATMSSITEINVSSNLALQLEAFDAADAGSAHAYELVRNMKGDFTALLKGPDGNLKSGDEFKGDQPSRIFNAAGNVIATGDPNTMFNLAKVTAIAPNAAGLAMVRLDSRHFYELICYDDANDTKTYMANVALETNTDPGIDVDQRIIIRSIGYVMSAETATTDAFAYNNVASSAVVDIVVGLTPYPAVISNDDIELTNSITISGAYGSVHANDDLRLGTGNFTVSQTATYTNIDGTTPSGYNTTVDDSHVAGYNGPSGRIYIPDLKPCYYAKDCDYIFIQQGVGAPMRTALITEMNAADEPNHTAGNILAAQILATGGTAITDTTKGWAITRTNTAPYTYTVQSFASTVNSFDWPGGTYTDPFTSGIHVKLKTSGGGGAEVNTAPTLASGGRSAFFLLPQGGPDVDMNGGLSGKLSVVTTGNVKVNGNATLVPKLIITPPEEPPWERVQLLVLAGEDVKMLGNANASDLIEGVIYAHEQFDLSGSGNIRGQVVGYETQLDLSGGVFTSHGSYSSYSGTPIDQGRSIVQGNFEITHDDANGYLGTFSQLAWRQLHDFNPVSAPR